MNISGISAVYMGILIRSTAGSKGRKDYISILESDMVISGADRGKKNNNFSDSDNKKENKKIKISRPDKYYGE